MDRERDQRYRERETERDGKQETEMMSETYRQPQTERQTDSDQKGRDRWRQGENHKRNKSKCQQVGSGLVQAESQADAELINKLLF